VQASFDHPLVLRDPGCLVLEPAGAEPAGAHSSDLLRGHQSGLLENLHVLLDAGKGDLEVRGQIADRGVLAPEVLEDAAAGRIRQGGERPIEPGKY
jgi:hypothetical protein